MSIDTTCFSADLAAMIDDLPTTAKFGAIEFACAASELTTDETLILTGNNTNKAVRCTFPKTAFTATTAFKPQARFQLKFPDPSAFTNYDILSIATASDNVAYDVTLRSDNRSV